ncbi:hypothetical protein THAOC_06702 [Thalassiosira oceanica]|uniref:Uncharacterized protein n=1 Tax=Thalassiosira oceanica TaxID=159749 RepID=K0T3X7_THAOC|nr:hypothetical protein THAOC_06702 [Thalassiosira oceanica]|eukprot:EJK71819.1 hypothetical protein THAOC_06702 [Thalassiosira oceanica]
MLVPPCTWAVAAESPPSPLDGLEGAPPYLLASSAPLICAEETISFPGVEVFTLLRTLGSLPAGGLALAYSMDGVSYLGSTYNVIASTSAGWDDPSPRSTQKSAPVTAKEQDDGDAETFHFLQYSGTRQLAEDIERVACYLATRNCQSKASRMALPSWVHSKLKQFVFWLQGLLIRLYAAWPCSVTVFPDNVNLMVLDGCQWVH